MVYKHKHNKKARSIAARKLQKAAEVAAAAAAAATLVPVGGDGESATAGYCDAGLSSTLSTGGMATSCAPVTINCKYGTAAAAESLTDANMGAADAEEMFQEKQSKTRQQQQPGTSGDRSCSDTSGLLYSAPPTPADWARLSVANGPAGLPSVLAATHLPCIPGITPCSSRSGADGGGEGQYVAYLLSEQLSNGTTMPVTMWGVYSLRDGDCLQVVHWHHSPVAQESPLTNVGLHPPPTSSNAQQTRELIMRVDAAGLCFMLAPSSLVSMDGSGAAGCMTLNSVCSDPDTADDAAAAESADVYWLIPSVMKESFFALLQAREWLRTAPLCHPVSEACTRSLECQGWFVQPHPTRWASAASSAEATVTVAREQHKSSSPATATLPLPKRKTKKAKRERRQPSPRAQPPQCKESTASTTSATNGTASTSPFQYLIPYVAAVQQPQKDLRGVPESHLPSAAVPAATATPVVLLIGNRIASYPAGEVCSPRM